MTPCPAVRPSVLLLYTFWFFVQHRWRSPFFQVFPCSIHLLSTSNNGSIGFTPQTTSKMISLSKDILLVSKIIYPLDSLMYDSMCKVRIFRNVQEVLVKSVNTPPPHPHPHPPDGHPTACATCYKLKKIKSYTPICSFLKCVTLPRDRKWHISKLATLPRAPYQPHAKNNNLIKKKKPKTILHPF